MNARDELYEYMTVAFQETGVPNIIRDHVNRLIGSRDDTAALLRRMADEAGAA